MNARPGDSPNPTERTRTVSTPRPVQAHRHASPAQRLAAELRPERSCEEDLLKAIGGLPDLDLLAAMVERATKREWLDGAERGRREVEQEHTDAGCLISSKRTS